MRPYTYYIILIALMLAGCNESLIFSDYKPTPVAGWEKNEDVTFDVAPLKQGGTYNMSLSLRLNDTYPFQNLHMIVRQTIYPKGQQIMDTLTCRVTDHHGTMLGKGVTFYHYSEPLRKFSYRKGDSIHVSVSHNMKREILPGIADVGIVFEKE